MTSCSRLEGPPLLTSDSDLALKQLPLAACHQSYSYVMVLSVYMLIMSLQQVVPCQSLRALVRLAMGGSRRGATGEPIDEVWRFFRVSNNVTGLKEPGSSGQPGADKARCLFCDGEWSAQKQPTLLV